MSKGIREKFNVVDLSNRFDELVKFRVPTGIIAIDRVIGGGIPSGKLTEIAGGYSAGKTRLVCHILNQALKMGGVVMLIDLERALDKGLAKLTNLDINNERFVYPELDETIDIKQIFDLLDDFIIFGREEYPDAPLVCAIDSIAAMPSTEDLEKPIGEYTGALRRAKLIGDGMRKYIPKVYKSNVCWLCVNQVRDRIDVMFGEKTQTPGGKAVKFYASLRIKVDLVGSIKDEKTKEKIATKVRLVNIKSKVGVPFGLVNFKMPVDKPIDEYAGLLDYLVRHGEVKQAGAWYNFPGEKKKFMTKDFVEHYLHRLSKQMLKDGITDSKKK